MIFYLGSNGSVALRPDKNVVCSSLDDFGIKMRTMVSNGMSSKAFESKILPKTFSESSVTGREARTWLAGLLKDKVNDDYGLFEFHRADSRLLSKVKS